MIARSLRRWKGQGWGGRCLHLWRELERHHRKSRQTLPQSELAGNVEKHLQWRHSESLEYYENTLKCKIRIYTFALGNWRNPTLLRPTNGHSLTPDVTPRKSFFFLLLLWRTVEVNVSEVFAFKEVDFELQPRHNDRTRVGSASTVWSLGKFVGERNSLEGYNVKRETSIES